MTVRYKEGLMNISNDDLDLIRQWFDAVQDLNPEFLTREDYVLAGRIYSELGIPVPTSIEAPGS